MEWDWAWFLVCLFIMFASTTAGYVLSVFLGRTEFEGCTICWWDEDGFWAVRSHTNPPMWRNEHQIRNISVKELAYYSTVLSEEDLLGIHQRQKFGLNTIPEPSS